MKPRKCTWRSSWGPGQAAGTSPAPISPGACGIAAGGASELRLRGSGCLEMLGVAGSRRGGRQGREPAGGQAGSCHVRSVQSK